MAGRGTARSSRPIRWLASVAALAAVFLAGCSAIAPLIRLPSDPAFEEGAPCLGVGLDDVLHGSTSDARITWAIDRGSGRRLEIVWPVGYGARFTPALEVLDARGVVVGREGDSITGTCWFTLPDGPIHLTREDIAPPP